MDKFWKGLILLISAGIFGPVIKDQYDIYTAPVTGTLVGLGTPDYILAFLGAIPWIFPVGVFVYVIIMWSRPDID